MTETQRRIKELKRSLPNMKEKVVAVAVLLALSLTMMASVSYAWVTLSTAPEVGSIRTTVSANGNLEVALATDDGKGNLLRPNASGIGDSFSADDQDTKNANITWGNLINLSNNYGIEDIVLRPATFYQGSPAFLTTMTYGLDGRVLSSTNKFDFTSWLVTTDGHSFMVPEFPTFGVRAISTVRYPGLDNDSLQARLDEANVWNINAVNGFASVITNTSYITALEGLIQSYLDATVEAALEGGELPNVDCSKYAENLYKILNDLYENAYKNYGEALVVLANISLARNTNYTPYTLETLLTATEEELETNNIALDPSMFTSFVSDYNMIKTDAETMRDFAANYKGNGTKVYWEDIENIVNNLININKVRIQDLNGQRYTISELRSKGKTELISLTGNLSMNGSAVPIYIYDGLLMRLEQLCGYKMSVNLDFAIKYSIVVDMSYTGRLRTILYDDPSPSSFSIDTKNTRKEALEGGEVDDSVQKVADHTYGMVIDLWVRTNAKNSVLALDGMVETVTYDLLKKLIPSGESESRQEFVYTYYTGNMVEVEAGFEVEEHFDVNAFQIPEDLDGNGKIESFEQTITLNGEPVKYTVYEGYFYDSETYNRVALRDEKGETVKTTDGAGNEYPVYLSHLHYPGIDANTDDEEIVPATYSDYDVVGFHSSNRIDDNYSGTAEQLGAISATQGTGSCYVFYATPEEAEAALELLRHLKLAFCDVNGTKLATANLAVDYVFADSGKYVVPLQLEETDHTYTFINLDGKTEVGYGITTLTKNEATLISVVVYLDGTNVDNTMVMAKDSILGSLNIQFGSSADLSPMTDRDLAYQQITLSASVDKTSLEYPDNRTTKLTANITGLEFNEVKAVFRRQINASQGSTTEPVTLGSDLTADVTFALPGTYVLRSLWVDGVEYDLPESSWITVVVDGFNVSSVGIVGENVEMTADSYVNREVRLTFQSEEQPSRVAVRFVPDEGGASVTATLTKVPGSTDTWSGTARFTSSGTYTMTYVVMDGEDYSLSASQQQKFTAYLGLRAEVALQNITAGEPVNKLNFVIDGKPREFKAIVRILTDNDKELKNLQDLTLYYAKMGSSDLQKGLDSPLTWDGNAYIGTFSVNKVGAYNFAKVEIGASVVSVANSAATIRCTANDLPSWISNSTYVDGNVGTTAGNGSWIYLNNKANGTGSPCYMVTMKDASGAESFTAVFKNPNGETATVVINVEEGASETNGWVAENPADETLTDIYFRLPAYGTNNFDGSWELVSVRVTGVYDKEGKLYGTTDDSSQPVAAAYFEMTRNIGFTVLETVEATVSNTITVGGGQFMTGQAMKDRDDGSYLTVTLAGNKVALDHSLITGVSITLRYKDGCYDMGGYTFDRLPSEATLTYALTKNADNTWSLSNPNALVYLAGNYQVQSVNISIGDITYTDNNVVVSDDAVNGYALKVYSSKPSLTVYSASTGENAKWKMNGTSFKAHTKSGSSSSSLTSVQNTYDSANNVLTVYIPATYWDGVSGYGTGMYYYFEDIPRLPVLEGTEAQAKANVLPQVVLELSNAGSFDTASFTLSGDSSLSIGHTFNRTTTTNGRYLSSTLAIGNVYGEFGKQIGCTYVGARFTGRTVFGNNKELSQITIVRGDVTYTVTLEKKLTINNPA